MLLLFFISISFVFSIVFKVCFNLQVSSDRSGGIIQHQIIRLAYNKNRQVTIDHPDGLKAILNIRLVKKFYPWLVLYGHTDLKISCAINIDFVDQIGIGKQSKFVFIKWFYTAIAIGTMARKGICSRFIFGLLTIKLNEFDLHNLLNFLSIRLKLLQQKPYNPL